MRYAVLATSDAEITLAIVMEHMTGRAIQDKEELYQFRDKGLRIRQKRVVVILSAVE